MQPPSFSRIDFDSDAYREECQLRDRVLRQPLGLSLFDEDLSVEASQLHFGGFDDSSSLIACVIAMPLSETDAKIRQMAVAPEHSRQGHGSALLRAVEYFLHHRGYRNIHLHARVSALPFYQKAGYREHGSPFTEVGLPHLAMKKRLSRA
ncbi:GNAT family N-acetyltransferase [Verrucomicrobiaceae bacterium 5K15]|uniref:GNAT family N-acetyltransferase n=1 Tax=Oceaniferula flava TaxID=2800421 RepID=A0AAE2SBG5_9BACT|nr:GNAT family N-acetyltransferase [Oceaniferula flavus]MBK1854783.1 GNAT family N-acetyltransferase [Oceaniferula flavus]MBM1136089.1 GNAT family N-acetyltransferase [Oceaniferula flavus]